MIGIGIDIQSVERTWKLFSGSESSLKKIFSDSERDYCFSKADPYLHLAGKFAVKEAVVKALAPGREEGNLLEGVEVNNLDNGAPVCVLKDRVLELFNEMGGTKVHISISHNGDIAVGVAFIE